MTTLWRYSTARLLIAMVVAATIFAQFSGASRVRAASDDSNRYYERAQGYLAKGELQSAIIELKNADVYAYEDSLGSFVLIDNTHAECLLKRLE